MFAFLFCVFFIGEESWRLDATGAYRVPDARSVVVATNGDLFLLLPDEALIKRYDASGKFLNQFGGKGHGPGEFQLPFRLFFQDGLYVLDIQTSSVSRFTAQGELVESVRLPEPRADAVKVTNGWVFGDWNQFQYDPEAKAKVWWADPRFGGTKPLFDVVGRGAKGTFANDGTTSVYSPVSATPKIAVNREGTRVFVADAEGFRIRVVDPAAKKVIREIRRQEPTLEFNPEWADIRLNEVKQMMPDIVFKTNYPEYFPIIRNMWIHPEGWIVVDRWTRNPADSHVPLVLDEHGEEIRPAPSWEALRRWSGSHGPHAYVCVYDSERGEMTLARCPKDEVEALVAQNPLPQD